MRAQVRETEKAWSDLSGSEKPGGRRLGGSSMPDRRRPAGVRQRDSTVTQYSNDDERFAARQQRLLSVLACPNSAQPLVLKAPVVMAGAVLNGELWSTHGMSGVIRQFRPSFLDRDFADVPTEERAGVRVPIDVGEAVGRSGTLWEPVDVGILAHGDQHETLTFESDGSELVVTFFGHSWSGVARIETSDGFASDVDLYRLPAEAVQVRIPLGKGSTSTRIEATGRRSSNAAAAQVVVTSIEEVVDSALVQLPSLGAVNRGNPYPDRFRNLVANLHPNGLALDCGGGDRRFGDDRVFNLEYMNYRLPDLYADGLRLPFKNDSFDLILSQAVLEHVPDPQRAVDEMIRVLKPGGLIYIEVAFMQPLHAVPSHYMNVTPYGLRHLCTALDVLDEGVFGGLTETFSWFARLIDAPGKIGQGRCDAVLASLRDLDAKISNEELHYFASATFLEGRKKQGMA